MQSKQTNTVTKCKDKRKLKYTDIIKNALVINVRSRAICC